MALPGGLPVNVDLTDNGQTIAEPAPQRPATSGPTTVPAQS